MKKIITLLFCLGIVGFSFAQYSNDRLDDGAYIHAQKHFGGDHYFADRDMQIERINRDFNFKINAIENDYTLRRHQKRVAIRSLEIERSRQIEAVKARFHDWHRGYDRQWYNR